MTTPTFESSTALGHQWLNVAARRTHTEAEGPGERYALWVQGCPLRCKGCCNPHYLADVEAELMPVDEVAKHIIETAGIEGVTMIGGEPFWQAGALAQVARQVQEAGLSVMVFSGLTLSYIKRQGREDFDSFLAHIDLLVDGPYVESKRVMDQRWIGSSNQRVHFLTDRYRHMAHEVEGWDKGANTIELRMVGQEIFINGYPEQSIIDLAAASIRPKRTITEDQDDLNKKVK